MNPRTLIKRDKPFSVSSIKFYLNKDDRTSHWVGHLKVKELYTIELFEIKQIIEDMEAEMTEPSEIDSKTENLTVTEEADVDEAIPTYLKK